MGTSGSDSDSHAPRKLPIVPELRLPQQLDALIPEAKLFLQLTRFEQRIDAALARMRLDAQRILRTPRTVYRTLRIFLAHEIDNDTLRFRVHGHLVNPDTGNPDSHRDRNRFSHYVRNAAVQLQAPAYSESECILEWNRNDEDVDLDGIELTARAANEDTHCRVLLNLEQYPPRWVAPDRLAAALGLQMLPTKENVLESLWAYIRRYQLLHAQDPTQVICDEVLRDVFGLGQISIDTLPGALDKVLRPADPLTFLYHLRLDDADKCRQVYDISMQIPDSHPSHIAALPETPERDAAEISQLHERCRSLLQEIGDRLQGYQFMAAFSESPVDVMRVAIANQARDLSILAGHGRHPSPFVDWGPGAADEYVSQFSRSS